MKKKTLTVILSITLLICVGGNIYQNMTASKLRERLSELTNAKNELTAETENRTIELNNVTSEIETANTTIEELTAKVDSLTSAINATHSKIDGINSTHTDVELGDNEYKGDTGTDALQSEYDSLSEEDQAVVKQIEEELKKEHPEWFADTAPSTSEGNYEDVGTPDNTANTPQFQFDPNDTDGLSTDVTVY